MPTNRPLTLSAKDVSKAVDNAVKLVSEKHKMKFSPEFRIGPGTIIGRQLLQADIGIKQAEQLAAEITQQVSQHAAAASHLEPVVLIRKDLVLCGFYPGPIPEIEQHF